jgi:hypothetical protein
LAPSTPMRPGWPDPNPGGRYLIRSPFGWGRIALRDDWAMFAAAELPVLRSAWRLERLGRST